MTNEVQNLIEAIAEWRGTKAQSRKHTPTAVKNPYGAKIYDLNMRWAAERKAHAQALEQKRQQYLAEVEKFQALSKTWEQEHKTEATPSDRRRGPKPAEHSDAVKIAAAAMLRAGHPKTQVRVLLGLTNTERLNQILREGEELLQVQELKARDAKHDAEEW